MGKKIVITIFILFIGVISFIGYNFYKNLKTTPESDLSFYKNIPTDAAIIFDGIQINQLHKTLTGSNIIWSELTHETDLGKCLNLQLSYLDSLIKLSNISSFVSDKSTCVSLHLSGAKKFYPLLFTKINHDQESIIKELKKVTKLNFSERIYEETAIFSATYSEEKHISLAISNNVLALSFNTSLIEDFIRQSTNKTSLLNDLNFKKVVSTHGNNNASNIFIQHKYFQKLIALFLNKTNKRKTTELQDHASWSSLDLTIKNNAILLNGFSSAADSNNYNLKLIKGQSPQELPNKELIPNNISFIYSYGISDNKKFISERKNQLKKYNSFFNYQNLIDQLQQDFSIDFEEEFLNQVSNEITYFITEVYEEDNFEKHQFIITHVQDQKLVENTLTKLDSGNETTTFNEYEIHYSKTNNIFPLVFGSPFPNLPNSWWTIIDDYVIFARSEASLKNYLSRITSNRNIDHDENFAEFEDNLQSNSNIFIYNNIARSVHIYPSFLREELSNIPLDKQDLLRKFEAIAIQISGAKNDLYYNNIYLKYNPVYKQETRTVWETNIDTTINGSPQLVVNHTNGGKEIFVQDKNNKIYLIGATGKTIWTKQLDNPILGKVHQIDAYKNNKLQLLFNTKNKIYLIDKNGNNVEKYPIKLKSKASNGIAPLDYDGTKNYRLLIGTTDNKVLNYTIKGDLVNGWKYRPANSPATSNIWHFSLQNKDYIVIPLQNGKIKIVERSGKDRIVIKNQLPKNSKHITLTTKNKISECYLAASDSNGTVTKIYFNDKTENISFSDVPKNASFNMFDINNDQQKEFIFTYENKLIAYNSDQTVLLDLDFENDITATPTFFKFADSQTKIGITCGKSIYLIDNNGRIVEDFPLAGSSKFVISKLSNEDEKNLVVADSSKLYMYNIK